MIIALLVLLLLSGIFSSAEIAFVVSNKTKLRVRARKKMFGAGTAIAFFEAPEKFLSTALVGNNIVNIAFASLSAISLQQLLLWDHTAIFLAVTGFLLFFGEIIPKSAARLTADAMISYAAVFIKASRILLFPLIWLIQYTSMIFMTVLGFGRTSAASFYSKKDFELLLRESEEAGEIKKEDRQKLSKVITLSDVLAKDIMKPRTEIIAVSVNTPVKKALQVLGEKKFSKLFVYAENIDHIVGVVLARDFFKKPRSLSSIMREVLFVPETKNCSDLFREFRQKSSTLAVVVDEFGGTAGVVTSQDILEEFLGEFPGEEEGATQLFKKLSDGSIVISGNYEVEQLVEKYRLVIPEGRYETLAGYIVSSLGRIPAEREEFVLGSYRFRILRASRTHIEAVLLRQPSRVSFTASRD
ncbi:MAG: HlyC/CorC family transporter [Bacteroidota bacterium]|nr:HlyC/CorC family transporter [Bacteroidota bacterium]